MEIWQKDLLEVLRDIAQRIPGSYIYDIDRGKVMKQIDSWQEQSGNVIDPGGCAQLCAVCAYWLEDPEYKGLGACGKEIVHDQLIFGHVDMFLISGDFGCKYFKRK